jgi:prealbumin domain-containing protein
MVRIFGSSGRSRRLRSVITALAAITTMAIAIPAALASHPEVSLTDSNFEIDTDANLKVDDAAPSIDWASVSETRQADQPTGANDDSFGQGTKEDTAVPTVVDGSIPPNKSDLLNFGVYLETNANGRFLNLFWHRVQEPSGTTNMDFEFNKSSTVSGNGVTPARSAGDLLIQYDLAQGGTNPQLFLSRWVTSGSKSQCEAANATPCWGARVNLSALGDAAGSINTSAIASADADGLGNISPRTFGEAQLDFDALAGGGGTTCTSFGSAYLKSRSSDSFTAALKDFIAPTPTNITNCGTVNIHKQDDVGTALAGATFTLYTDNTPVGGAAPHGAEDVATSLTCSTNATGNCSITSVPFGNYWAVETTTPAGHDTAADQSFSLTTATPQLTISLTFVDPRQRGAIKVTKLRKHAASGAGDHAFAGVNITVNGVTKATDANGVACFDGLLFASYTVHETVPAGYHVKPTTDQDQSIAVNNAATCSDATYVGETATIHNVPLTDLTVSVSSQVTGGTNSKITCTGLTPDPVDSTPDDFDDTLETVKNLEPGTYTCTVVIDP